MGCGGSHAYAPVADVDKSIWRGKIELWAIKGSLKDDV